MDKIRVMLADDNRSVLQALSEYLNKQPDTEVVAAVTDGVEVVSTVAACAPDVLILDIIMPRQDGFMTLEKLGAADFPVKPKVLVLSGLARDEFILRAVRLGASYYMVKPFDPALTHARIVELAGSHDSPVLLAPETPEESADEQITNLFLTLGIPAHIRGYQYLREAVQMVLEDHDLINRITKMRTTVLVQGKYSSRARKPLPQGVSRIVGCKSHFCPYHSGHFWPTLC